MKRLFAGVALAWSGVQLLVARTGVVQSKQQGFHAFQMFGRFGEEHLVELAHVVGHASLLTHRPEPVGNPAFLRQPSR